MKKATLFLAALFLVSAGCSRKKENPAARMEKALSAHKTIHYKVTEKYSYSYSETLFFSDYRFDNVDLAGLKAKQTKVLQQNPVEVEGSGSEEARLEKMLHIGDKAPLFSGTFYANGKPFHLAGYVGKKIILVDFWYTHCPPCVRAIPEISKLYAAYRDKGLIVFGLNSVDNRPGSLKYLKAFLSKRDISYPVVLTQPAVDLRYKINGYPTLYLIDKKGKVAYVEIGFDQQKLSRLKEKVREITGK